MLESFRETPNSGSLLNIEVTYNIEVAYNILVLVDNVFCTLLLQTMLFSIKAVYENTPAPHMIEGGPLVKTYDSICYFQLRSSHLISLLTTL